MALSDIIQIIIGILSLIATVAVSFVIYWLQMRHEKELQKLEDQQKQNELEEKAKIFLMDHENERDYLPWCVLAANLHRLERHTRVIYREFCRCPEELRNEILKQAGFEIASMKDNTWVDVCIEKLKADIKKYNLGGDYLYDRAKYFHRGYQSYRGLSWGETPCIFESINKNSRIRRTFNVNQLSIGDYIDEYFYYYIDKHMEFKKKSPIPPIDYVWDSQDLATCEEEKVCMWLMELTEEIALNIRRRKSNDEGNANSLEYTDAQAETFEDKYYEVLQALYNTYYEASKEKKSR